MAAGTLAANHTAATGGRQIAGNLALFLAAPFIGLAYIIFMPLVAFGAVGVFMLKGAMAGK
jgi:hypothetical protein